MLRVGSVIVASILISQANQLDLGPNNERWKEFQDYMEWKQEKQQHKYDTDEYATQVNTAKFDYDQNALKNHNRDVSSPPPVDQAALMARYVVNQAGNLSMQYSVCMY